MKQKMTKKGIWYAGTGVAAVLVAVLIVVVYRRENQFQPVGSDRDLQVNQVVFSEDDASAYGGDRQQNSEDEIWKKDEEAQDQNRPDRNGQADYLFEENELARAGADSLLMPEEGGSENVPFSDQGMEDLLHGTGSGYVLTADADQADWIISGPGVPGLSGGNTAGSSEGENGSNAGNGGSANGNSGNAGETPGQGNAKPTASPSVTPEPSPSQRPSDRVPDPEYGKDEPSWSLDDNFENKKYSEDNIKEDTGENVDPSMVFIQQGFSSTFLYNGQKIDDKIVYCALDTFVRVRNPKTTDGFIYYYWDMDDYNQYIRIDAVSFDGGNSWNSDFPVTIPDDPDINMQIKASYRFSTASTNWMQKEVEYYVVPNCIYVLAKKLPEENPVIQQEDILNNIGSFYPQYLGEGESLKLFNLQEKILGQHENEDGILNCVFPGWSENGERVSWFYTAGNGRHILEPEDVVPVEDGYTIQIRKETIADPYSFLMPEALCSLQTLTDYRDEAGNIFDRMRSWKRVAEKSTLKVPDYVQAVVFDDDKQHVVDYLEIPESVIYMDINAGITVNEGYKVDPQNMQYAATEDGMLMDFWETEILGIPYKFTEVTIPSDIYKVNLAKNNKIQTIKLLTEDEYFPIFPEINYENLNEGSRIVVKDEMLEEFMKQNYEAEFSDGKHFVTTDKNQDITYKLVNDLIIDSNSEFVGIAVEGLSEITLPKEVASIGEGVFKNHPEITGLIWDKEGQVKLEKDCFAGSSITTILCHTEEQYKNIMEQLQNVATGASRGIKVICLESQDGYVYRQEEGDAGNTTVTLLQVPKDIESFDGTIPGTDITVTEIGANAFAN